jgi:LPXTG-motif cell wall-anchored protein
MVDYAKGEFNLAPAVSDDLTKVPPQIATVCTPTSTPSPSPSSSGTPQKESHTGAIAGGVVGGVAGLALIGVAAFLLFRRRKKAQQGIASSELSSDPAPASVQRQMSEMESPTSPPFVDTAVHEMPTSNTRHNSVRQSKGTIPEGYMYN